MNFSERAATWDTPYRIKRAGIIANEISQSIPLTPNTRAMEFGCGTGLISFNLADRVKHIDLIDPAEGMIDMLKEKITADSVPHMSPLHLDLMTETVSQTYDLIFSSMVLHHIQDTMRCLEKLFESLNPQGHLCIVELDEDSGAFHMEESGFDGHNGFSQEHLKGLAEAVGFIEVASHTFYQGEKQTKEDTIPYSLFILTGRKE